MSDIVNMRAAAKAWRANAIASGETVRAHDKIDELINEIERLRAALDRAADALEFYDNKAEAQKARRALEPKP